MEAISPGAWLLAHVPWTEAEHTVSACEAGKAVAKDLQIKMGAACLLVERRTWDGDTPITLVRMWHQGEIHKLIGRFERKF
jgi:GntR family histidine utilization transcriptional repressor